MLLYSRRLARSWIPLATSSRAADNARLAHSLSPMFPTTT
jgi:hypothetical protein